MSLNWLSDFAYNSYSQFGEDGVLQAIFSVIGAENEWCFECGAADGLFFSNTRRLIEADWKAVLVEADLNAFKKLQDNNRVFGDRVHCVNQKIDDTHRIEGILQSCGTPLDLDLAIIDVDGQDYYVFNSLLNYRPRVVVIEFDPLVEPDFLPALNGQGQAGYLAIERLAAGKYYTAVHRNHCNLILVRNSLLRLLYDAEKKISDQKVSV